MRILFFTGSISRFVFAGAGGQADSPGYFRLSARGAPAAGFGCPTRVRVNRLNIPSA